MVWPLGGNDLFCPGGSPPLQRAEFCIVIRVTGRGRKDCLLPRMVCGELAWGRRGESELDGVGKTLGDTGSIPFRLGYEQDRELLCCIMLQPEEGKQHHIPVCLKNKSESMLKGGKR